MLRKAWGSWALAAFALHVVALWPVVVLAPSRARAWACARAAARSLARSTRTRCSVRGREHLRSAQHPCVLVSNHTSELDILALAAALPIAPAIVAKQELGRTRLLRRPLARLGVVLVRRDGVGGAPSQVSLLVERLRAGEDVLVFPEGTFARTPGLLPLHRGAFLAAALVGAQVVPVVVRGARAMTARAGGLPRPGALEVLVAPALQPRAGGDPEQVASELLEATRRRLLELGGEGESVPLRAE